MLIVGATHAFAETRSPDVVLIPGGRTTMEHARDERLLGWVPEAHETATWIASVCSGSVILAAAGLPAGKRATSHWMALGALKALGANAINDGRIVHEGDIVTSAGVCAGIDLARWLAGQIAGEGRAKAIQLAIEYDPQPPFDSGHVSKASVTTRVAATALLSRETFKPAQVKAMTMLMWEQALRGAQSRRRKRREGAAAVSD